MPDFKIGDRVTVDQRGSTENGLVGTVAIERGQVGIFVSVALDRDRGSERLHPYFPGELRPYVGPGAVPSAAPDLADRIRSVVGQIRDEADKLRSSALGQADVEIFARRIGHVEGLQRAAGLVLVALDGPHS
jgi:hypothetical protein